MKKPLLITFCILFLLFFLISNLTIFNMYFPHSYPYRFCAAKCDFEDLELGYGILYPIWNAREISTFQKTIL